MGRGGSWETYMKRAAVELGRACAETAAGMEAGRTGVREIRELAGAMKDLTALHAALEDTSAAPQSQVQVVFDRDAEESSPRLGGGAVNSSSYLRDLSLEPCGRSSRL